MSACPTRPAPTWTRRIETPADLDTAIAEASRLGHVGWVILARALRAGLIKFLPLLPDTSATHFKTFARLTAGRPAVVLIGDDDSADRGPAGWSQAERAVGWAASVLLHAAGAEPAHYIGGIEAAQLVRRLLIVECSTATLPAWADLAKRAPSRPVATAIVPRGGAPHPRPLQAGEIQ